MGWLWWGRPSPAWWGPRFIARPCHGRPACRYAYRHGRKGHGRKGRHKYYDRGRGLYYRKGGLHVGVYYPWAALSWPQTYHYRGYPATRPYVKGRLKNI